MNLNRTDREKGKKIDIKTDKQTERHNNRQIHEHEENLTGRETN